MSNLASLRDGDIIFQESRSAQSDAIQRATHSPYSHMGVVFRHGGRWYVYEAVQPVKRTPIDQWIARGRGGRFVVKRLRRALTPDEAKHMRAKAETYFGKPYDLYFEWSDARIYCSEYVWKIYKSIGVEAGGLQQLRDFDLSSPPVSRNFTSATETACR